MTGFGAAAGEIGGARLMVEIRTVNHRHHAPNLKLPAELSALEQEIRERLRKRIARGHVTLSARIDGAVDTGLIIDESRFAAYAARLRDLQNRYDTGPVDLGSLLRLPGVVGSDSTATSLPADKVLEIVDRALDALVLMREQEGARLVEVLRDRLAVVSEKMEKIAARAPERLIAERERLRQSVRELTEGVDVDPSRLAQEVAILADKLDVSEEIDRFRAHAAAFGQSLASKDDKPVGRRLTFLLQEMLRETNTTGSKSRDAEMLHEVVGIKEELERIGEQIENLE